MKKINKFIFVDVKKLKKRYRSLLFAVSVPFFQFNLVLLFIYWYSLQKNHSDSYYTTMQKLIALGIAGLILYFVIGISIARHFINVHKKNTFIEISDRYLILSRHTQTCLNKLKPVYYKRLYVIKLISLQNITISKGKLVINGEICVFSGKSNWLLYSFEDSEIAFDEWWYNHHAESVVNSISIPDYYLNSANTIRLVRKATKIENARIERHKKYHEQMMELAKNNTLKKQNTKNKR